MIRDKRRIKVYRYFRDNVFKVPEGQLEPIKLRIVRYILFPTYMTHDLFFKYYVGIEYNPAANVYKIEGTKFSGAFLKMFRVEEARKGLTVTIGLNEFDEVIIEQTNTRTIDHDA